jgi:DNA-binding LacI/PurR family transcriptional regulator
LKKKVTFREIAQTARVSVASVSRVARGSAKVSSEIVGRVRGAALELGLELKRRNCPTVVGFLLCNRDMLHPFHSRLLSGAESHCASNGCSVLFLRYVYDRVVPSKALHPPDIVQTRELASGFILAGVNSPNLLELLSSRAMPIAVLGNNVIGSWEPEKFDCVWFDDAAGAFEMTRYLQALGHRDIWYVGNCQLPWFSRRYEGYRRAMVDAGLEPHLSEADSPHDQEAGYLAAKSLLGRGVPVSAIFAGGDTTAHGVYKALLDCRLRIPDDVSVAGFDDIEAAMMHPALTTVQAFPDQIGKRLAQLLIQRIGQSDLPPQSLMVPTQLVKRESCRAISPTTSTARMAQLSAVMES